MFQLKFAVLAALSLTLAFLTPVGGRAEADEPVLLTIEGGTTSDAGPKVVELNRTDLEAFPSASFTTTTNWTSGPQTFVGVPLLALLEEVGATAGSIEVSAINDYSQYFPIGDPTNEGAIVAYLLNGQPMTPRDKGPLWLVYNYDSDSRYRTETVYSRSIWQLDRIVISR